MNKITSFFVDDCINVRGKEHLFVRINDSDIFGAKTPEQFKAIPCELFVQCVECSSNYDLGVVPKGKLTSWLKREPIQSVFPEFDADTREMMISGICPECWNKMFAPKPEPVHSPELMLKYKKSVAAMMGISYEEWFAEINK